MCDKPICSQHSLVRIVIFENELGIRHGFANIILSIVGWILLNVSFMNVSQKYFYIVEVS